MTNLLIMANLVSLLSTTPTTEFSLFSENLSSDDKNIIVTNEINDWNDYQECISVQMAEEKGKGDGEGDSISTAIEDVNDHLNTKYPDYYWIRDDDRCALTSDISNEIPIEMQTTLFPEADIKQAIINAGVQGDTSYGGCGPIAAMGILDYFSRYLGYTEIISDPTDKQQRISLATEVLKNTHFSIFGSANNSLVWPWDYSNCFNTTISKFGLSNVISASDQFTLGGGSQESYRNTIVNSINEGLPVTMFTGLKSGNGEFAQHYTNIYGYDTWIGVPNNGGDIIEKTFVKARLNWGRPKEYYCDADILNRGQVGVITYNVNYSKNYSFYDYDFAEEFVNDDGGGQYFFNVISEPVILSNERMIYTERLRCSYIEDKYLVLSPKRAGAGIAYLDILFPHHVSKLEFTASMWSDLEDAMNENFKLQYMKGNNWVDHINIVPYELTRTKDYPDNFNLLFPRNTNRIRFYASHSNPNGDRNKGRIVLDDFVVRYN